MRKGEETRTRMIEAAAHVFEREGFSGGALNAILDASGAPRGSLYFHFPGGKEELAVAAIEAGEARLVEDLGAALAGARTAATGIARVIAVLAKRVEDADFDKGCPVSSAVIASSGAPETVRGAASRALANVEAALAGFLVGHGTPRREAERRAGVILAAIEGALVLARVHRSTEPLTRVAKAIPMLLGEE